LTGVDGVPPAGLLTAPGLPLLESLPLLLPPLLDGLPAEEVLPPDVVPTDGLPPAYTQIVSVSGGAHGHKYVQLRRLPITASASQPVSARRLLRSLSTQKGRPVQSLRVGVLGDMCGGRASLLLPVGAALTVPDGPPPSTGVGSTGADVGVAPLLPPAAGAFGVGAEAPPLPPDGAEGVEALTGLPPLPPPPLGWGAVVVVDWGAATGAGVVGDRPPVVCWDDGARGPTVFVVPAKTLAVSTSSVRTGNSRLMMW